MIVLVALFVCWVSDVLRHHTPNQNTEEATSINIRLTIYMEIKVISYYNIMWNHYYIIQVSTPFVNNTEY